MRHSALLLLLLAGCATGRALDESKVIDLTHPFNDRTVYWPTANRFQLTQVAHGPNAAGEWYASNDFCASEHGGTHLDAPIHFAEGKRATADIPISQLIGPARVIDIRQPCAADPDYLLAPDDIEQHERAHGRIEPGDAVLILTGFGQFYPDAKRYLGSDKRGAADDLHFPGIGEAAARLLVERGVDLVGLDTASLDHGPSRSFVAHRVLKRGQPRKAAAARRDADRAPDENRRRHRRPVPDYRRSAVRIRIAFRA